jgi:hypothetical protein
MLSDSPLSIGLASDQLTVSGVVGSKVYLYDLPALVAQVRGMPPLSFFNILFPC